MGAEVPLRDVRGLDADVLVAGDAPAKLGERGALDPGLGAVGAFVRVLVVPVGEEAGKKLVEVNGKNFLLEEPLHADVAICYGTQVDKYGNVRFHGTTRNFNVVMATAADTVIMQADEIVDMINPDDIVIQGILVDYIVDGGAK